MATGGQSWSNFLAACKDLRDISYKALKSRVFTLPVKELEAIFER